MDDKLKGAFQRNVKGVVDGAYSAGGRSLYGPEPSGNYADGPLPEYFAGRENSKFASAIGNAIIAGIGTAGAFAAPELAPGLMPYSGMSGMIAASDHADSKDMGRGADMWSNTGLPQRPKR
jgi:hypothetical protein